MTGDLHQTNGSPTHRAGGGKPPTAEQAMARLLDRALDHSDVQAATERVAAHRQVGRGHAVRVLVFGWIDQWFAFPAAEVDCVAPQPELCPVPGRTNATFRGLAAIEGELLLVGNLGALLGLEIAGAGDEDVCELPIQQAIVIGRPDNRWVVTATKVLGVWAIEPEMLRDPPLTLRCSSHAFAGQLIQWTDQQLITLLDVERVTAGLREALA